VKIASRWFSRSRYGTVMGIISLSYLFGDAAARQFMSMLIAWGLGWRGVFYAAGGTLCAVFILTFLLLKETPLAIRHPEPQINPPNVFGADGENPVPFGVLQLLKPLLLNVQFWLVCALSLGFTLVRETFNLWTPTYFTEVLGFTPAAAASSSAVFPLSGGVSV